jgi:hypothetical protein
LCKKPYFTFFTLPLCQQVIQYIYLYIIIIIYFHQGGNTPLHLEVKKDNPDIARVRQLIDDGANINAQNKVFSLSPN